MIEIKFEEFADYWFEKWKSLVAENEKLRIHNRNVLDKINEQRGKLSSFEHSLDNTLTELEHERKENKRLLETIDGLHEKIKELEEKLNAPNGMEGENK